MSDLIPPIGVLPPSERLFRVNWVASLERSPSGLPLLAPEFVARQGRSVRLVDLREPDELVGALGSIPGVDWVPRERALSLAERLDRDAPVVLISRGGERSATIARQLEQLGLRFCASLRGGMVAWRAMGFGTTRDPSILARRDVLREITRALPAAEGHLDEARLAAHVGDALSTRWIKAAAVLLHARRSCVDGRDDTGVIGTPGGDGGELVLALAAVEQHLARALAAHEVKTLLARSVDAFGSLTMHTDIHAGNAMIASMRSDPRLTAAIGSTFEALEWRKWLSAPPLEVRSIVLEHIVRPEHLGCGHMRLMLQHSDDYQVRAGLVSDLLAAYLSLRWEGASQLDYVPLPGGHREGAVVNIRVEGEVRGYTPIPLVSPSCGGTQMFVNHPQVSESMRSETAAFLCEQSDLLELTSFDEEDLCERIAGLAQRQLGQTLGHLARGLPIFDVRFLRRGGVEIERVGTV